MAASASPASSPFLPTPSARRATLAGPHPHPLGDISTHALREEGDARCGGRRPAGRTISTHALREEGDGSTFSGLLTTQQFLPTPSARRATRRVNVLRRVDHISTHALREEGDCPDAGSWNYPADFYPRPPRGGRPSYSLGLTCRITISTHALREEGDGKALHQVDADLLISTHALREEGDLVVVVDEVGLFGISTHALREEGDAAGRRCPGAGS